MRKLVLLLTVITFLPLISILAQPDEQYILEHRGDTLVVKDDKISDHRTLYIFFCSLIRPTLFTVPAGRVYMLHKVGYYSLVWSYFS